MIKRESHHIYRALKPRVARSLARAILEQALLDLMRKGTPVKSRERYFKDAHEFFESGDYETYCACAELDIGHFQKWIDHVDTTPKCTSHILGA